MSYIFELIRMLMLIMLQEYSQHVADNPDLSESVASTSVDISTVGKHSRVPSSSQDDVDEPACSMEDVIQLLQLLSAVASDTQSTGMACCYIADVVWRRSVVVSVLASINVVN